MDTPVTREHVDQHVPKNLRNRVRTYLALAVIIVVVIGYRLFVDQEDLWYAVLAFVIGSAVGIVVSRMYKIWWDTDAEKVASRLDIYGIVLLVAYVAFELLGEHYIRQTFAGPMILTMILALSGGAVLGRGIGIGRTMFRVLRANIS
jgi:uncharacterized membrane protein YqgA involved in biofilm formation